MYKQSINNIKVVIIPLDGTIFNLNRYRYNYYHHLCDHKNIDLDIHEFYSHLSSMYDMYKGLPLSHNVDTGPLNAKIERELLQYLKYKGIEPKEGFLELLEYLHQKHIHVAVMSTHRTKDAVEYLQMSHIYHNVHFIIGSDTTSLPLPSTQILETIQNHFHVTSQETLVISSFMSLNRAANELKMNVIYCEDLVKAQQKEKETSYKVTHNLFEVLNTLLFDQYEEMEMYSPILGMNSEMNYEELTQVRDKLEKTYREDSQIIELIDRTYAYHVSQLGQQNIKDGSLLVQKAPSKKQFQFTDEEHQNAIELEPEEDIEEDATLEKIIPQDYSNNYHSSLNTQEEDELTILLQQISHKEKKPEIVLESDSITSEEIENVVEEREDTPSFEEDTNESPVISFVINFLYILAVSFLVLFIGLIIYIAFIHQFDDNIGLFSVISTVFHFYQNIIESLFGMIFNGLHSVISFFPSYNDYVEHNAIFSVEGVHLFNLYLFQTIIIAFMKPIVSFIKKRSSDHENDDENYSR